MSLSQIRLISIVMGFWPIGLSVKHIVLINKLFEFSWLEKEKLIKAKLFFLNERMCALKLLIY